MEFEDLASITPSIASALRKNDVTTIESLAMQTLDQLKEILKGVSEKKIRMIQIEAWKAIGYWFTPADMLSQTRKEEFVFTTGCKALDEMLAGGIRTRCITEFVGEYGSGKTESLLTILVETLGRNKDFSALFFDSEESFSEKRVTQIASVRGYEPKGILSKTLYVPVWHTQHFMESVRWADRLIKERNVKLILVDSIIAPLRAEYVGREVLWERQQLLNKILRDLLNYAKAFNLSVVMTNQVVANPQVVYTSDPLSNNLPTGGNILAHNAETRIYLRKAHGNRRIARLIDSSWLPPRECVFQITKKGIEDIKQDEEEGS
mgnify:CR=1 FL=1